MNPQRLAKPFLLALLLSAPFGVGAQEMPTPALTGPILGPFAAMRVAIVPVQFWRADTSTWSVAVTWAETRLALDSAIAGELRERGLARRWAYAADVVRSARRNPTYATDPFSLGVGRWRAMAPKIGDPVSDVVADNLRPLTALGDSRYALIPVELRAEGAAVVLRLVLVDTRARSVVWTGDLLAPGGAGMIAGLAGRVADLVVEP